MVNEVLIVIPTRNRWDKLVRCLDSIPAHDWIKVCVVCDADGITHERLMLEFGYSTIQRPNRFSALIQQHSGSVHCRNWATQHLVLDSALMATDDVEFHMNSIEMARWWMNEKFPDGDGVIGFTQEPNKFHKTGVCLVGAKFLDRYPNRWLYNPDYFHFACPEILWLAEKYDKFFQSPDSEVHHKVPRKDDGDIDQTHWDARMKKPFDFGKLEQRKKDGKVWPLD